MHKELHSSLEQIRCQVEAQASTPTTESLINGLSEVCARLEAGEYFGPAAFGSYYQLVFALLRQEPELDSFIRDLQSYATPRPAFGIHRFDADGLGGESVLDLYRSCFETDPEANYGFLSPRKEDAERCAASIQRGLDLMTQTAPELAGEVYSIVHQVLLASSSGVPGERRFDGASSYMMWGALILNALEEKSDLEMMETLAHEAGHSLLFGMTIDEPLVLNDESELYASPLRADPRPMDGIYHATFVSARMHYSMLRAQRSGLLSADQITECESFLAASEKAFDLGLSVVQASGRLSESGRKIMANAEAFMDSKKLAA